MARKGNSIIHGIEIDEIIAMLNRAYADEWLAYYQYFIEAKVITGIMAGILSVLYRSQSDHRHHERCRYCRVNPTCCR